MATIDTLMRPYVEAGSLEEAEAVLDRLVLERSVPDGVLGDCYDDLAEAAAEDDDFAAAARLEREAVRLGTTHAGDDTRTMLAWFLICAGEVDGGEALFADLRTERPDDVELIIAHGHARLQGGLAAAGLAALDEALAVARRTGDRFDLIRALVERRGEREHLGMPPDDDDLLAPEPMALGPDPIEPVAWTLAWFAADQRAAALARWPGLAEDFEDPAAYARRIEGHLRDLRDATGRNPSISPLDVAALGAWAEREGLDPDTGAARSRFAAEVARAGGAVAWPPGRNEPCWCGSGRKYKRCCGTD